MTLSAKGEFERLKGDFERLKGEFERLKGDFGSEFRLNLSIRLQVF